MIKNVKISPTHILVNDRYFPSDLRDTSNTKVQAYISQHKLVEAYTDEELVDIRTASKLKQIEDRVQNHLDKAAKTRGYESILAACTYGIARGRYQQEGMQFAEWRTDVWDYLYTELDKISQGTRSEPTIEELIVELPVLP